jgi:antitoxin (DNA-binding transcriptional repressor) of toxin-antitoxin stability system
VRKTRKPIRITRYGKPVAELVPLSALSSAAKPRKSWLGAMEGTGEILGDIVSPDLAEDENQTLRW